MKRLWASVCALAIVCVAGGCGSGTSRTSVASLSGSQGSVAIAASSAAPSRATAPAVNELTAAEHPQSTAFPAPAGHTLRELARMAGATADLNASTSTFTPGTNRYGYGLTTDSGGYVYAPSAIYLARTPDSPAEGPFLAPADSMHVPTRYLSEQGRDDLGIAAIYHTEVPLPQSGVYAVLSLTRAHHELIAASGEIAVAPSSPIPALGRRPPEIQTDTLATVHGDIRLLTTRVPAEDMHSVSFAQVLGRQPIAYLVSTPALCTSRVCGPVTDIMVDLQHQFGSRIAFIHQEVFVDDDPADGLRPQLRAFHLQTEPWLFTIDRRGIIAARLDGPFGVAEARQALEAALR